MHRFLKQSHTDILFAGFSHYILGILSVTKSDSSDVQQCLWTERWACCQPHLPALPAAMDSWDPSSRGKHRQDSFASENSIAVAMGRRSKKPFSFAQFSPASVHGQIWSLLTSSGILELGGLASGSPGGECPPRPEVPKVECHHWQQ